MSRLSFYLLKYCVSALMIGFASQKPLAPPADSSALDTRVLRLWHISHRPLNRAPSELNTRDSRLWPSWSVLLLKTSCASGERLASLVFRLRRTLAPSALDTRALRLWLISHRPLNRAPSELNTRDSRLWPSWSVLLRKTSCASGERLASLVFRLRRTLALSALDTRALRLWFISHRPCWTERLRACGLFLTDRVKPSLWQRLLKD